MHNLELETIYDFGMNDGSNLDYYLSKRFNVVGVDANPHLCQLVERRYFKEVEEGRLRIINAAVSSENGGYRDFFIHRSNDVLSQIGCPEDDVKTEFSSISVPCRSASSIVSEHGRPHYIKIDLEHHDHVILSDLFSNHIYPDFVSAEYWTLDVFAWLVIAGYGSYNLVDGRAVPFDYGNAVVRTPGGLVRRSFGAQSAGPFGEDLAGPWYAKEAFVSVLAECGLGWRDIHASRTILPSVVTPPRPTLSFREHLRDIFPSIRRGRAYLRRMAEVDRLQEEAS